MMVLLLEGNWILRGLRLFSVAMSSTNVLLMVNVRVKKSNAALRRL
jgi:hypothetical protein